MFKLGCICLGILATPGLAEVPLAPAEPAAAIRWAFAHANRVSVSDWDAQTRRRFEIELRADARWREEVDDLLTDAVFRPRSTCFCHTPPTKLWRDDRWLLSISVHHGRKFRLSVNPQLGELSGDYETDEAVCKAFIDTAYSRLRTMQAIRASAETVLSR